MLCGDLPARDRADPSPKSDDYDLARERIREALPWADACGLVSVVASLALLWAEIDLAEDVRRNLAAYGTEQTPGERGQDGVAHVTRLLEAIRARVE